MAFLFNKVVRNFEIRNFKLQTSKLKFVSKKGIAYENENEIFLKGT
jgi:hypothetical protein